jgi:hypothetical protein
MGSEDANAHARGLCRSGRGARALESAAVSPLTLLRPGRPRQKVVPT